MEKNLSHAQHLHGAQHARAAPVVWRFEDEASMCLIKTRSGPKRPAAAIGGSDILGCW